MIKKIVLMLLIIFVSTTFIANTLLQQSIKQPIHLTKPTLFTVKKGDSLHSVTQQFVNKGWLVNTFWLKAYVRLHPELSKLKIGTYQLEANSELLAVLTKLVEGKEHQFSMTFVEGSTFKEWLNQLAKAPHIHHTLKNKSVEDILQQLNISQSHPEGLFFPETYAYTANTTDKKILLRAHQKMNDVLAQQWQARQANLPYKTRYEALIMASIIEKESGVHAEQPVIASVFVNRLNKKMRLQTDPTVIYGLGERYKGDIKYKHLKEKTPYNTYRINGLTPTPIAMPGIKAINAALQPAQTEYFYFVSNGYGQHTFSRTLAEHNKAVKVYLSSLKN